jgi:hypothetical protein
MNLEFKDLTYHCNITDNDGLRVHKGVGWDSVKGTIDVLHHTNRMTASITAFKGIELSNEVLNTCDVEMVSDNLYNIGELTFSCMTPFRYLHQIQRSYLSETNSVLEYKPIV